MAKEVWFHIGVPKSGTTFLQATMWRNRRALSDQGWLYPGRRRMDHYHASHEVRGKEARQAVNAGAWRRLVDELAAFDGTGLISHEFFSMASRRQANQAIRDLAPADVHVVVTARDYLRQFPAVWQEALKMGSPETLDAFMDRALARELTGAWGWRSQDLPAILARWSRIVPQAQVHIITLPPPGQPRDLLWQRWRETLGFDDSAFDLEAPFANESLGVEQVALMQRVATDLDEDFADLAMRHRWFRQYFGHEVLGPQRGAPFGLRPHHAEALAALSSEAARSLAAGGYSVTGSLDDLEADAAAVSGRRHPDDVTDSELMATASRALRQMIIDVRGLTTDHDEIDDQRARTSLGRLRLRAGRVRRAARRVAARLRRTS